MQFTTKRDTTSALIWGVGLSLAGLVSLAVSRVVHVLKGKKEISMPRIDSGPLACAAMGVAQARTSKVAARTTPANGNEKSEEIPIPAAKRVITVRGIFRMGGRLPAPAVDDDQIAYLDE